MHKQWQVVCMSAEISDAMGTCVQVGEEQIALFRVKEILYAVGNYDPFSQAHVISRGEVSIIDGRVVVASPVFTQFFDLKTGLCLEDPSVRINVYQARSQYGLVEVNPTPIHAFEKE